MGNRPKIDVECGEGLGYFMDTKLHRARDLSRTPAVIHRAQRLWNGVRAHRDYRGSLAGFRPRHQLNQELRGDLGHIAGQNQIPFGTSLSESRMYSRERPAPREDVFKDRITKVSIPANGPDQSYIASYITRFGCNVIHQWTSFKWKAGFVTAHARTAPSGEYERGAIHAEMITLKESSGLI